MGSAGPVQLTLPPLDLGPRLASVDSAYHRLHEHQRADSRTGFPTLWGTPWYAVSVNPRKPIYIQLFTAPVSLTLP